jgi:hypothetical protein
MSKKKLPKLYRRKWLNTSQGSGYIIVEANVTKTDWGKRKGGTEVDGSIEFKDCHRQINLEFYYHNQTTYNERLKKIAKLKDSIEALEAFMLANPPLDPPVKVKEEKTKLESVEIPGLGIVHVPVKAKPKKKAPKKPVEAPPELLLTERHPDPPSLRGELTGPLAKPSIIEIGPTRLSPTPNWAQFVQGGHKPK